MATRAAGATSRAAPVVYPSQTGNAYYEPTCRPRRRPATTPTDGRSG
jgi:hypothetical protein